MKPTLPSCTWLFSIAAPLLCLAILGSLTTLGYYSLREASVNGSGVRLHSHAYDVTIPRDQFFIHSLYTSAHLVSRPIQSLNFPGMVGEILVSLAARSWPDSYRPASLGPLPDDLFIWRAIIFPFYCLPFWTFAGLGLDGLLGNRKLRWPILLLGTLICAFFLFIAIGLACASGNSRDEDSAFIWWGFALWIPLVDISGDMDSHGNQPQQVQTQVRAACLRIDKGPPHSSR